MFTPFSLGCGSHSSTSRRHRVTMEAPVHRVSTLAKRPFSPPATAPRSLSTRRRSSPASARARRCRSNSPTKASRSPSGKKPTVGATTMMTTTKVGLSEPSAGVIMALSQPIAPRVPLPPPPHSAFVYVVAAFCAGSWTTFPSPSPFLFLCAASISFQASSAFGMSWLR